MMVSHGDSMLLRSGVPGNYLFEALPLGGAEDTPLLFVSWNDMVQFCEWIKNTPSRFAPFLNYPVPSSTNIDPELRLNIPLFHLVNHDANASEPVVNPELLASAGIDEIIESILAGVFITLGTQAGLREINVPSASRVQHERRFIFLEDTSEIDKATDAAKAEDLFKNRLKNATVKITEASDSLASYLKAKRDSSFDANKHFEEFVRLQNQLVTMPDPSVNINAQKAFISWRNEINRLGFSNIHELLESAVYTITGTDQARHHWLSLSEKSDPLGTSIVENFKEQYHDAISAKLAYDEVARRIPMQEEIETCQIAFQEPVLKSPKAMNKQTSKDDLFKVVYENAIDVTKALGRGRHFSRLEIYEAKSNLAEKLLDVVNKWKKNSFDHEGLKSSWNEATQAAQGLASAWSELAKCHHQENILFFRNTLELAKTRPIKNDRDTPYGLGLVSNEEANRLGELLVGPNPTRIENAARGERLIGNAILYGEHQARQYRFPEFKSRLGMVQANLERFMLNSSGKKVVINGHLSILHPIGEYQDSVELQFEELQFENEKGGESNEYSGK